MEKKANKSLEQKKRGGCKSMAPPSKFVQKRAREKKGVKIESIVFSMRKRN
jgi:hypothetical protein